jgi:hypothetical protein
MTRIDLDDLPPKIADLLVGLATGEAVLLVQMGVVVGRLVGEGAPPDEAAQAEPALSPEETAKEIFEQFRSSIEDEF